MNRLEPILEATRAEVARRRAATPADELPPRPDPPRPFREALAQPGRLSVIAEHKRRSPSAGKIREDLTLEQVVTAYERGGAAALSVLTDQPSFGGSLDDLLAARAASTLPVLRKDFIVDRYQVRESAAAGADAILLIVAALTPAELAELHAEAADAGLEVLVEVHDSAELDRALDAGAEVIGINNRDLTTLKVDIERTFELIPRIPDGKVIVSESGLRSRAELDRLAEAGVDAVLIGEALMRSSDPEAALRDFTMRAARP
ncbi:MAG TPA: indole-3-glycerol phosphate synthase TrpC [Solirubrobacteraceae bacterium]|nr:indole-3-glycerol phosphate synthase TrpC [Solirubrobacteraceae bacterium]